MQLVILTAGVYARHMWERSGNSGVPYTKLLSVLEGQPGLKVRRCFMRDEKGYRTMCYVGMRNWDHVISLASSSHSTKLLSVLEGLPGLKVRRLVYVPGKILLIYQVKHYCLYLRVSWASRQGTVLSCVADWVSSLGPEPRNAYPSWPRPPPYEHII
jgi:hypothetical protein